MVVDMVVADQGARCSAAHKLYLVITLIIILTEGPLPEFRPGIPWIVRWALD